MAGYFHRTFPPSSQWAGIVARLEPIRALVGAIQAYPRDPRPFMEQVRNPTPAPDPKFKEAIRVAFPPADAALGDILRSPLLAGVSIVREGGYALDIGQFTKGMFLARTDVSHADLVLADALNAFCEFVRQHAAAAVARDAQSATSEPPSGQSAVSPPPDAPKPDQTTRPSARTAPLAVESDGVRLRLPSGEFGPLHPLDKDGDPLKAMSELLRAFLADETPNLKAVVSNPSAAVTKAVKLVPGLAPYISRPGRADGGRGGRIRLNDPAQSP